MSMTQLTNGVHNTHPVTNGNLDRKLQELSLLKSPGHSSRKPVYLGDDEDHSARVDRFAISPSPKQDERHAAEQKQEALAEMSDAYRSILHSIGEDPARQGLLKTPARAAKALLYFTKGYDEKISGKRTGLWHSFYSWRLFRSTRTFFFHTLNKKVES